MKTTQQLEADADRLLAEYDAIEEANILDRSNSDTISCKIGGKEHEYIRRLCEDKLGCTLNEGLQMCVDVLRRYMEDRHNLSPELQQMIDLFEGFRNWDKHINLAEPLSRKFIVAAIYILAQPDRVGRRMVMADGKQNDLFAYETVNMQTILDTFMESYDERLYRELRLVGANMGCTSICEILHRLVSEYKPDSVDDDAIRKMFEDNRRSEYGHEDLPEGGPYKRTMVNSMEAYERKLEALERRQTKLQFDDVADPDDIINQIF